MSISPDKTLLLMKKVGDWQLANLPEYRKTFRGQRVRVVSNGWYRSVFYAGVMALWRATGDETYLRTAQKWAKENAWQPGRRPRHADDHCACQTYLDLYAIEPRDDRILPTRKVFDDMAADPLPGQEEWWWCDALFMAPPALARLATLIHDNRYLDVLHTLWWDAVEHLYDAAEHLFYRDEKYKVRRNGSARTKGGQKIFWSRGNGWVLAGIARVLQYLPDDDIHRQQYIDLFNEMARTIASLQSTSGYWPSSLLAPDEHPEPETSGTALICYAFAWALNHEILCREIYLPVIRKAWEALTEAIEEDGRLTWTQPSGEAPGPVQKEDSYEYGVGAFLLAGSEIMKLSGNL